MHAHAPAPVTVARRRAVAVVSTLLLATVAGPAGAAKWHDCPTAPAPAYPSTLGATNAPFAHPGHELKILLNDAQVAASGGFSTAPDGNRIEIEITSLYGAPIVLAPRTAAAASPTTLAFTFPDTATEVGRVLAGPTAIRVLRGEREVARIAAKDLVALPPATDVTALFMGQDRSQILYGALDANGDLWVPASFHGKPMPMPGCPGDFMMPLQITVAGADVPGISGRKQPLERMRRARLYFADFEIDGHSFYGVESKQRLPRTQLVGTRGVTLCKMNDAIDLVLRVKGSRSWARAKRSPFAAVVRDAAPVPLKLRGAQPMPAKATTWRATDDFGATCEAQSDLVGGRGRGAGPSQP